MDMFVIVESLEFVEAIGLIISHQYTVQANFGSFEMMNIVELNKVCEEQTSPEKLNVKLKNILKEWKKNNIQYCDQNS